MSETITLPKNYEPSTVEASIYSYWLEAGAFHATPDQRPPEKRYVVMMPLPNVTGALHMGHAMDNVMQDLLIRWHRMQGDNTLWMPGTDHAGIATQAVVEKRLKELEGLTRHDVGREGLVQRIWQWKDQYQARIVSQQQRMGCSCDWSRQRFTMDAVCARAVRHTFHRMFRDGLIFRGKRLVNWDPFLRTSISDDEIYHETVKGHFWHLNYPVIDPKPGEPEIVTVATTRPETMLGDTAVAVHPDPQGVLESKLQAAREALAKASEKEAPALEAEVQKLQERIETVLPTLLKLRDMALDGRKVRLPLLDRPIPLICDEWPKPELGSGCVKITPAHDTNDYGVWTRHRKEIDIINILNPDGTLNEAAGPYAGLDRYEARTRVVDDLTEKGLLPKIEDRDVEIGHSDRSKTPVEPYLSDQWYVRMGDVPGGVVMGRGTPKEHTSPGLVQAAMDAVIDRRVQIHPERYMKTYLDWLSEKRDWPISRQLWWGHQIPIWSRASTLGEVDLGQLAGPMEAGAVVRVYHEESGESRLVTDASSFAWTELGADDRVHVDVCLLTDDETLVTTIESAGWTRDPDVLDTWFSSALWPHSTLGWPDPATAQLEEGQPTLGPVDGNDDCTSYYYPGSCLVTARDIITLWVARMVLTGFYNLGDIPFSDVFIHANILDGKGERMSKSKGNGIDPVDIIEAYGTDAMRYVLCEMQTGNQDIRLPVTAICPSCGHHNDLGDTQHGKSVFTYVCGRGAHGKKRKEGCGAEFDVLGTMPDLPNAKLISERFDIGRAFCTKLWNSARFALMNLVDVPNRELSPDDLALEDRWILDEMSQAVMAVHGALEDYNPASAIQAARDFFWGSLCDWYLELIKPRLQNENDESAPVARQVLAYCLDVTLRLFHPFTPFITEQLWQYLNKQVPKRGLGALAPLEPSEALIQAKWPSQTPGLEDAELRSTFRMLQQFTRAVREVKSSRGLPPRQTVQVTLRSDPSAPVVKNFHVVEHLAGISSFQADPQAKRTPGAASTVVDGIQLFIHDVIDDAAERERLTKELARVEKEIANGEKKLSNEGFVKRAPAEVVQAQRDRLAEIKASREALQANLAELG